MAQLNHGSCLKIILPVAYNVVVNNPLFFYVALVVYKLICVELTV